MILKYNLRLLHLNLVHHGSFESNPNINSKEEKAFLLPLVVACYQHGHSSFAEKSTLRKPFNLVGPK